MQERKSLTELAKIVMENRELKRDYVAPSASIYMNDDAKLELNGIHYDVGNVAHEQLASKLDIPKKYYDRMLSNRPVLLSDNVNTWLRVEGDNKMVRTLGSKVRAILSDRYRPMDNDIILETILPILMEHKDYHVISSELTERRMYMMVTSDRLRGDVKVGDTVQMGLMFGNSEVGLGSLFISPFLYVLKCLNGAVMQNTLRKYHVGKRIAEGEDYSAYRRETIEADQKAFLMKVRDNVRSSFDELTFQDLLKTASISADRKIVRKDLQDFVEDVTKKFDISGNEQDNILTNLINGGDLSQWGMSNAVTAVANETDDYDRAVDLQRIGGRIIELSPKDWRVLAE